MCLGGNFVIRGKKQPQFSVIIIVLIPLSNDLENTYKSESDFRVKCYDHLNLQELSFFNIERLDILYALIGHLSKIL